MAILEELTRRVDVRFAGITFPQHALVTISEETAGLRVNASDDRKRVPAAWVEGVLAPLSSVASSLGELVFNASQRSAALVARRRQVASGAAHAVNGAVFGFSPPVC